MTTTPKAKKFRIRKDDKKVRSEPQAPEQTAAADAPSEPVGQSFSFDEEIDAIRREGLTGRQLRMARRVATKQGLAVTSDFDAVRQLRGMGIDPLQRDAVLELVAPKQPQQNIKPGGHQQMGRIQLPQTVPKGEQSLQARSQQDASDNRTMQISKMQQDIVRRRRRKLVLLFARLSFFVLLPTIIVGYYFSTLATPMYATKSEYVIQQSDPSTAGTGLGGLFAGTSMATQQDSITVQSYLTSRAALARLDQEIGFRDHFSQEFIDPIQRLEPDASAEDMFALYQDQVQISYDPSEGIVRMEVIAADPQVSQQFSQALINYAEEQVDQLTLRLREDQMAGARSSYLAAEERREEALATWLQLQEQGETLDPIGETAALTAQIASLEQRRQNLGLSLNEKLSVATPVKSQVDSLRAQIANIDSLIDDLRQKATAGLSGVASMAENNFALRQAEENYTFQTMLVQQALAQMETAQVEAGRQVRYLSVGVEPIAPDEPTYPRVFENTFLAAVIFSGIYLMLSLTASILREQVTS